MNRDNAESSPADTRNLGVTRRLILSAPAAFGFTLAGWAGPSFATLDPIKAASDAGPPQRGGTLTRSIPSDPPNFDTLSNTTGRVMALVGPCCNGLVRFDELSPDKVVSDLAESWEVSADGLAYTFRLKQGVKFHDGKPFSSADVKYTFDTVRNPPQGIVSVRAKLLEAVDSIIAIDPQTVRFLLKRRSPGLLSNLAGGWMVILPKHLLEKGPIRDTIVGTGPFKLKDYKRGTSIELVRNPDYHVKGKPYLDGIKVFIIPDAGTEFGYFRTGQIDTLDTSSPQLALQWEKEIAARGARIAGGPTQSSLVLSFNSQQKPWDDIRVRQAACLAISREEALSTLMKGEGVIGGWSCPGPWALPKAQVEKIPGYGKYKESNIAQAKKLLADAGLPNGFKDTLLVRRIDLFMPFAIFIKDQLLKVGIDVTLDPQETAMYTRTRAEHRFKLEAGSRTFQTNDPDAIYGDSLTCKGALNFSQLCDPKTDELFMKQSEELDPKARVALVNKLEAKALSDYGSFPVLFRNQYRLYQKNVHGWAQHPQEDNSIRLEDCWKSRA